MTAPPPATQDKTPPADEEGTALAEAARNKVANIIEGGAETGDVTDDEAAQTPFSDDQTLTPDFVNQVLEAMESTDEATARALYESLHPADRADFFGIISDDQRSQLIDLLGGEVDAGTLAELEDDIRADVVDELTPEVIAEAVTELDTDDAAYVLGEVDAEKRAQILAEVPVGDRIALRTALEYAEETAGRLMQRDVFASPAYWTVGQIIDRLRAEEDLPDKFYEVFVIDPMFRPLGCVPLARLIKAPREINIKTLMEENVRQVPVTMDQEEVAYIFEQYNLISAPVIDENERLVGMITVDDVVEIIHAESNEDMLALAGVEGDSGLSDTVLETVRSRISWLGINLFTAILASLVIWPFSDTIAAFVPLAVLMPIVASMGGNAGTQTLTVAVRSLATKDITATNTARIVWREAQVGLLNGIVFAVIMGGLAATWHHLTVEPNTLTSTLLGTVVAIAMVINLLAAGLAGILIPIWLQRIGQDPAVSSAVFVTTVTDILGFFVFLGLASILLVAVL